LANKSGFAVLDRDLDVLSIQSGLSIDLGLNVVADLLVGAWSWLLLGCSCLPLAPGGEGQKYNHGRCGQHRD